MCEASSGLSSSEALLNNLQEHALLRVHRRSLPQILLSSERDGVPYWRMHGLGTSATEIPNMAASNHSALMKAACRTYMRPT